MTRSDQAVTYPLIVLTDEEVARIAERKRAGDLKRAATPSPELQREEGT